MVLLQLADLLKIMDKSCYSDSDLIELFRKTKEVNFIKFLNYLDEFIEWEEVYEDNTEVII